MQDGFPVPEKYIHELKPAAHEKKDLEVWSKAGLISNSIFRKVLSLPLAAGSPARL